MDAVSNVVSVIRPPEIVQNTTNTVVRMYRIWVSLSTVPDGNWWLLLRQHAQAKFGPSDKERCDIHPEESGFYVTLWGDIERPPGQQHPGLVLTSPEEVPQTIVELIEAVNQAWQAANRVIVAANRRLLSAWNASSIQRRL